MAQVQPTPGYNHTTCNEKHKNISGQFKLVWRVILVIVGLWVAKAFFDFSATIRMEKFKYQYTTSAEFKEYQEKDLALKTTIDKRLGKIEAFMEYNFGEGNGGRE